MYDIMIQNPNIFSVDRENGAGRRSMGRCQSPATNVLVERDSVELSESPGSFSGKR